MVILAAIDRSDRSERVLEEAESLAKAYNNELHVVHVLSIGTFVDLEQTNVESKKEVLNMNEVREVATSIAEEIYTNLKYPHEVIGMVGDVEDEIIRYAGEYDVSHIVLGPRKRSPTGKVLFGSVAQQVILNAPCNSDELVTIGATLEMQFPTG
ncbi:universal stress protein [Halalkalicoccus salilacus]|uniref:universal stress protein n=1 Tax=Halalkalicoccus TaxID=332246 RepID=UPI002F96651A